MFRCVIFLTSHHVRYLLNSEYLIFTIVSNFQIRRQYSRNLWTRRRSFVHRCMMFTTPPHYLQGTPGRALNHESRKSKFTRNYTNGKVLRKPLYAKFYTGFKRWPKLYILYWSKFYNAIFLTIIVRYGVATA